MTSHNTQLAEALKQMRDDSQETGGCFVCVCVCVCVYEFVCVYACVRVSLCVGVSYCMMNMKSERRELEIERGREREGEWKRE